MTPLHSTWWYIDSLWFNAINGNCWWHQYDDVLLHTYFSGIPAIVVLVSAAINYGLNLEGYGKWEDTDERRK